MLVISALIVGPYITSTLRAQSEINNINDALHFEASYTGDNVNNLRGGIKTGSTFLGMANIRLLFDSEKGSLWPGTTVYINGTNTHGATPSSELLGDMQVASNIEAGNHTYLQELWIKQTFEKFEITAGLQDLNVEFAASENGALFLNSSFGILPIISGNIPAPIFPLTTLGLTTKWRITEKSTWLTAIYDGSPTDFDYNPYNTKWQFISGDGVLLISELQQDMQINRLPGTYKVGVYTHNHSIEKKFNSDFPDSLNHSTVGAYVYADQRVWEHENRTIGLFTQLGYSPSKTSFHRSYFGLGINATGFTSKSKTDIFGLAVAHGLFTHSLGSETSIELTYQRQITSNIFLQPDLQYIINPSGEGSNLSNCLAATLRIGVSF